MKYKHLLLPLLVVGLAACSGTSDGYDKNWKPSDNAIKGAEQPIIKNPKGVYSDLSKMRSTQGKVGLPTKGSANLLVVPVAFLDDDSNGMIDFSINQANRDDIDDAFFLSKGSESSLPSVAEYYKVSSYGALNLSGVLAPTIKYKVSFTQLIDKSLSYGGKKVVSDILDYVYDQLFDKTGTYYLPDFDSNDDGKIDGVVLLYSWMSREIFGGTELYDYLQDLFFNEVFFENELSYSSPVNSVAWMTSKVSMMTGNPGDSNLYASYVGKMMGIEDYSDKIGDGRDLFYRAPLGHLDMMDGHIGDHNPFTKYQLGWTKPTKVTPSSIGAGKQFTLRPFANSGDTLLLAPSETGLFDEYLLVDYYTPTKLNKPDSLKGYPFGPYGFTMYDQPGIRVTKVNSRLVKGADRSSVSLIDDAPRFGEKITMKNGKEVTAFYDYAYTNDWTNRYASSGVFETYPLVETLSKKGANRHMTDDFVQLTYEDLFLQGDSFGKEGDIEGFYDGYRMDDGRKLGLCFHVDSLGENAVITIQGGRF